MLNMFKNKFNFDGKLILDEDKNDENNKINSLYAEIAELKE